MRTLESLSLELCRLEFLDNHIASTHSVQSNATTPEQAHAYQRNTIGLNNHDFNGLLMPKYMSRVRVHERVCAIGERETAWPQIGQTQSLDSTWGQ